MLALLFRELRFTLLSLSGVIFMTIYLVVSGCLLWFIPGEYNIPESGYASLSPFFTLSPFLFIFLIPALSMRSFAEEKRLGTLSLLMTRPVSLPSVIASKVFAVLITVLVGLIPTVIYAVSVSVFTASFTSFEWGPVLSSYLGLIFLLSAFVCIAVFASSISSNQVIAFIFGLLFCGLFYFGFELAASLFSSGKTQIVIKKMGFLYHYHSVQRGLIDLSDLFYWISISLLFFLLTVFVLGKKIISGFTLAVVSAIILFFAVSNIFTIRLDLTQDKRYSISETTRDLLKETDQSFEIDIYLDGNLNAGFTRLQQSTTDLLDDYSDLSSGKIKVNMVNPYHAGSPDFIEQLAKKGIKGVAVNEKNAEGRLSQNIVYPWAMVRTGDKEIAVPLLIHIKGRSGEENLNTSVEMLEYQFTRAIGLLTKNKISKIAFLQGHEEFSTETEMADAINSLSLYYQIDMGVLSAHVGELDEYEVVVVASPQKAFTEAEKYILDQYLMKGGKLFLLIDGVLVNETLLVEKGESPSIVNDVNLDDMLFTYGVRINPVLVEDVQCLQIPLNTVGPDAEPVYAPFPWYFAPLLNPELNHPVTKGLVPVKTQFASTLSAIETRDTGVRHDILLATSEYTHVLRVPEMISFHEIDRKPDQSYFNQQALPVAVSLEGTFTSVFRNRMIPQGVVIPDGYQTVLSGKETKMVVVASGDVIRNEIRGNNILPLGYDSYSEVQYSNKEFVQNVVNYLSDDAGLMALRSKKHQLQLLDKQKIYQQRTLLNIINIAIPSVLPVLLFLILGSWRKRKYRTWS